MGDTTQLSDTSKNNGENKFTTELDSAGILHGKKNQNFVTTEVYQTSVPTATKSTIYVSLSSDLSKIKERYGEKDLEVIEYLTEEIEKDTGLDTILFGKETDIVIPKNQSVFLIQSEVNDDMRLNVKLYKDRTPLNMLDEVEIEEANKIRESVKSKLEEIILPILSNVTENKGNSNDNLLAIGQINKETPLAVLEAVSNVMGLTILNHTAAEDNDTLLIFEEILLNSDHFPNISETFSSTGSLQDDDIPNELKNVIINALNHSNIIPLVSDISIGTTTTPETESIFETDTTTKTNDIPTPDTTPSSQVLNKKPIIVFSLKNLDERNISTQNEIAKKIENLTKITTLNVDSEEKD